MKKIFILILLCAFLGIKSQITLKRSQEIYCVGTSLTSNGGYLTQLTSLLGSAWNCVNYGVPGNTSTQISTRFPAVTNGDANTVILEEGINDLAGAVTATTVIRNIRAQAAAVKAANPNTKVILFTTSPFATNVNWSATKQLIQDTLNAAIKSNTVIANIDYVVDIFPVLGAGTNTLQPAFDVGDGLHWSATGQSTVGILAYNNATFTAFTSTPTLQISDDISISQEITPTSDVVFNKIKTTDSIKVLNGALLSPAVVSTGSIYAASSSTLGSNLYVAGNITGGNTFNLLPGGAGGYFTNGGGAIKFLGGSSYPDVRFCPYSWTNGRILIGDAGGIVAIGDIASMSTNTTTNLQIQTDMSVPICMIKATGTSTTPKLSLIPFNTNSSIIEFRNQGNSATRGHLTLNEASGEFNIQGNAGGYFLSFGSNGTKRMEIDVNGNVTVGTNTIATNASNGFLYIPTCNGTPTGTPTTKTGLAPLVADATNNKLYLYIGGGWVVLN